MCWTSRDDNDPTTILNASCNVKEDPSIPSVNKKEYACCMAAGNDRMWIAGSCSNAPGLGLDKSCTIDGTTERHGIGQPRTYLTGSCSLEKDSSNNVKAVCENKQ